MRVFISTLLLTVCFLSQFSSAQHFIRMSDRQSIELALDMIRKGVQQQDTTKVLMVFAEQVLVGGVRTEDKGDVITRLQAVFDNSSRRGLPLQRPSFPRTDNPLHASNMWDFDILNSCITIEGDSAFVECELVLWQARNAGESSKGGKKQAKLVFFSPPKVEEFADSEVGYRWPASPNKDSPARNRDWKLVGYANLLDFLESNVTAGAAGNDPQGAER